MNAQQILEKAGIGSNEAASIVYEQLDIQVRELYNVQNNPIHLWESYCIGDANESELLKDAESNRTPAKKYSNLEELFEDMTDDLERLAYKYAEKYEEANELQESINDKKTELADMKQEQSDKINEVNDLLSDFDVSYELGDTYRSIEESVLESISEREITYYSNAMEYLTNNDTSLQESLALAEEMGYSPANLSSEILATLLLQSELTDNWYRGNDEVEELIEAIDDLQTDIESLQEEINDLNIKLDKLESEEL